MEQLITKLVAEPWIIVALISWPAFLWFADFLISRVVIKKFKCKVKQ